MISNTESLIVMIHTAISLMIFVARVLKDIYLIV